MKTILFILFLSCFSCVSLWAQATAQISGTARDQSGAVLPGVEIAVTQTDTAISRNTVTNETGSYVLPNLPLGPYRLEAALPGFRTFVQTGIVLQVNTSPVVNVTLEVGQVTEQVEVQANAALVETRTSTVGSVVENQRIVDLPLNGRNVTDLIALAGGTVEVNNTSGAGTLNNLSIGTSPVLAVAGGAAWSADYILDGARHVNYMSGTTMAMPFPDAMQEFKVETTGSAASSTYSSSISAVTKAGTNQFHGDLFEFVRNDLFNATQYFAAVNPVTGKKRNSTLKRNQFGGTAGGALIPNKLFYFGGYQGTTLRQDPQNTETFIPTAAVLAGDWTAFTSPACNAGRQVTLRAPFVNNRIDPAQYSKAATFVVNWKGNLPFPTTNDPCGRITYGTRSAENDGVYVGKIDYQKSAKHSLFGRVMFTSLEVPNPYPNDTQLLQDTGYRSGLSTSFTFGSTYLLSASMVQSFRLAFNRNANHYFNVPAGTLFNWCDAGVKIYCEPQITRPIQNSITGAFSLSSGFIGNHRYVGTMYSLSDDISLVRGTHQIAFGGSADHGRQNNLSPYTSAHQFSFNGSATGLGLADFMLGKPNQLISGRTNFHHVRGLLLGFYAVDSWKATPKVTVNYGVRYSPYIPAWVEDAYNFDMDRFLQGVKSSVFVNAPAGVYYRGDPGFPEGGLNSHWLQFSPHVGLAWDVNGDGKTSIRTSYGFTYLPPPGDFRERYSGTGPWGGRVTLTSPIGGLDNPYLGVPGGDIFPYIVDKNSPYPPYGWIYSQPYDLPIPYQQSWNLSIQRQVGKDWLVTGTYLGSNLVHLWGNQSLNPAVNNPAASCAINGVSYTPCSTLNNTDARRLFSILRPADGAKIGYAAEADGGGIQRYSGMLLSVERRAAKGVTITGNYTLSHCIGPYVTLYDFRALWPYETYTNPLNRDADRGNCDSDRRQLFNLTSVVATPSFSNNILRTVATGWKVSGIYKFSTGDPLNIEAGSDRSLTGINHQRPNQILADPYTGNSGPLAQYITPSAFALPDMGTVGNVGHNSLVGPAIWSFDMGLSRQFNVKEGQRLEFRAEAFNILNSFRPKDPTVSSLTSNTFGQIRTAYDPRILQFALKYVF